MSLSTKKSGNNSRSFNYEHSVSLSKHWIHYCRSVLMPHEYFPRSSLFCGRNNYGTITMRNASLRRKRLTELITLSKAILADATPFLVMSPPGCVFHAMFLKELQTFAAIATLYRNDLCEQVQVLLRVSGGRRRRCIAWGEPAPVRAVPSRFRSLYCHKPTGAALVVVAVGSADRGVHNSFESGECGAASLSIV